MMQHLIFTLYDMSQVETITRQPPLTKGVGDASSRPSLTERNPHAFNCTSWKFRVKENSCKSGGFWDVSCEVPRPEVPFSHQCAP